MNSDSVLRFKHLLFLLVVFLYFFNLGLNQVWQPNESFYADASKNMLKSGDFLTPVYNGEVRLNKPPMTYWLTALSFFLFGINEFALRFFQALAGLGTALLTYLMGRKLWDERAGVLSFLALALSFQFIANSRYTSPEVLLTFFITLSIYLWHRYYESKSALAFFLALNASALAVLTKGPVGFVMPSLIIFLYLLLIDRKELLKLRYYTGTLYVALVSGWWFLYQYINNRDAFLEVFIKENIKRVYAMQSDPIYFYLLDINVSFLPYSFIFFIAFAWTLKSSREKLALPLVWFFSFLVVFSLVKMKLPLYIMPAFPAMAVLLGAFLSSGAWKKAVLFSSLFISLLALVGVWVLAFLFSLNLPILLVSSLACIGFLLRKNFSLAPAGAGFGLLLYLSGALLPVVEEHRPYRNIGKKISEIDPSGEMRTYEVGAFHYNLPFYADRVILRNAPPESIKPPALVLVRENLIECKGVHSWKLYKGSESKFFKFLRDIKRGKNFHDFKLCIFNTDM